MYTRNDAIIQVKEFINQCKLNGLEIEKAIIFGSVAKNTQHEFSDIDIALISNQFTKNFIENNKMTSKLNIKFPALEIHHFNKNYYLRGDPFIDEINATGLEVN